MATLLLIDDDPDLLRDRVGARVPHLYTPSQEIAQTNAETLELVAAAFAPTLFSLTCVFPTSPAWIS